jgi:hypothetical protein
LLEAETRGKEGREVEARDVRGNLQEHYGVIWKYGTPLTTIIIYQGREVILLSFYKFVVCG